eukprot:12559420-Alexandrium_andersonii.AAC.1
MSTSTQALPAPLTLAGSVTARRRTSATPCGPRTPPTATPAAATGARTPRRRAPSTTWPSSAATSTRASWTRPTWASRVQAQ